MFASIDDEEFTNLLYNYWDRLDAIKFLPPQYLDISQQEVRFAILTVLRNGIDDIHPMTNQAVKRHVLTIKEITQVLEQEHDITKSVQNVTHHVTILKESGDMVTEVATVKIRNYYQSYFGRTGKIYIYLEATNEDEYQQRQQEINEHMIKVVRTLHNGTLPQEFVELLEKFTTKEYKLFSKARNNLFDWFNTNYDRIELSGANPYRLFDYLNDFIPVDEEYEQMKRQIREYLGLDTTEK